MKPNLTDLMKEAQKIQERMQNAQKELEQMVVTGESGGGLVKVEMTGRHDVRRTTIDPSLIDKDNSEMLEDLVSAAFNDAVRKIERETRTKMGKLTEGLQLPTGFTPPTED
jgi:DNA-binding YbaB/EbfC family protein